MVMSTPSVPVLRGHAGATTTVYDQGSWWSRGSTLGTWAIVSLVPHPRLFRILKRLHQPPVVTLQEGRGVMTVIWWH